jgi:hypothetical protein
VSKEKPEDVRQMKSQSVKKQKKRLPFCLFDQKPDLSAKSALQSVLDVI